jgi:UDP-N-acetyl-D-mannosaminuronic acid dehydrogenase
MRHEFSSVCVVGLGYIGLPTAALVASRGLSVVGVDVNADIVATVANGGIHIAEADLDGLVQKGVMSGRLTARTEPTNADVFLIAVPTPLSGNKKPVIEHVFSAARLIAPHLKPDNIVIIESTCPVGTTEQVCALLAEMRADLRFPGDDDADVPADVNVAYCPERVLPGRILIELVQNDRCIGGISMGCAAQARRFYQLFVRGDCIETSARTAELVKLTENAFRDANIAFANELSMICDRLDLNVWEVIEIANRHPRVNILKPGPGVGGHCIAVDPWFIVDAAPEEARMIRTAREVNDGKANYVFEQARRLVEAYPDRPIACLGLAFKANVDDLRESPALMIAERLAERYGDRVGVVEPHITSLPDQLVHHGARTLELENALENGSILILLVDHDQFRYVDTLKRNEAPYYDTRGIWRG